MSCPTPRWVRRLPAGPQTVRYHVGVDGGGTSTRLCLVDTEGRRSASATAGPSALGQGYAQAWTQVLHAFQQATAALGLARIDPAECAIGLGLSGVCLREQVQGFLYHQPGFACLALDSDGFAGVLGAHAGAPGAMLVSGTGSIGESLRRDGSRACVGGWGWALGDEGSGAWLGRRAVQLTQRVADGRLPPGPLSQAVMSRIGQQREDISSWCGSVGQVRLAGLAPLVFACADDDAQAARLLDDAVNELEQLLTALDPAGDLPLVISGSVAEVLAPRFPPATRARLTRPQGDAATGALRLLQPVLHPEGQP